MTGPADLATFLRISALLLEREELDAGYGRECCALVADAARAGYGPNPTGSGFRAFLDTYTELAADPDNLRERVLAAFYSDGTLAQIARNVLITWYLGGLGDRVVAPEHYGSALVWPVIGAEAPGLPGAYFGSWGYPPPAAVDPPGTGR